MEKTVNRESRVVMLVGAVVAVLIAGFALSATAQNAYADIVFSDNIDWVVAPCEDDNITGTYPIDFMDSETGLYILDGLNITNVKSSNKKVAKIDSVDDDGIWLHYGMKTGSTTISFKVNGVPMSHKFTVKYTCPVKKFKVAGKSMLKTFKKKNLCVTKKTYKNKKAVIKAKKGWVITEANITKNGKYKHKNVKNKTSFSAKITTKWPYDGISLKFVNKKTGEEQTLTFRKYYDIRYAQAG